MTNLTLSLIGAVLGLVGVLEIQTASLASTTDPSPVVAQDPSPVQATTTHTAEEDTLNAQSDTEPNNEAVQYPPTVPFYSQFVDISDPAWKKLGCGVASLAMLIEHYEPQNVSVDTLLQQGIDSGAYLQNAGWTHQGLVDLSKRYGLTGSPQDLSGYTMDTAFSELSQALDEGPVIASVYYTFTPGHPIPHLVVLNGVKDGVVYYNDPAEPSGGGTISVADFKPAWKKRYIEIRPAA